MWAGCFLGLLIHFRYSLFEVKDDFISPFVIQTFRMTYFDLILTVFSGAYDAMVQFKCSVKFLNALFMSNWWRCVQLICWSADFICRIDTLDKGLCLNINGSLRVFGGFRFPIRQKIGKWSDISLNSIPEWTNGVVFRTYMLSMRVAEVWMIRVGLVIVGIVFAARYRCKRSVEGL